MDDQDSLKMILEWFTQHICKIEKIKKLVKGWKNERKSLGIKVQNLSSYQYSGGTMAEICRSIAKNYFFSKWIPQQSEAIFWSRFM